MVGHRIGSSSMQKDDELIVIEWPNISELGSVSVSLLSSAVHLCFYKYLNEVGFAKNHVDTF